MISLGIESTAHTFGVGIVDEDRILADERLIYRPPKGGIHPREAAQLFCREADETIKRALNSAGVSASDVDLVCFSIGPGLGPCLRTGAVAARLLAARLHKPLVGVNHCIAHIEIGKIVCKVKDPLVVYLSGANTQIIALSEGRYRIFGETLDIGLGNLLDSFARKVGLPFPGGPKIEELAGKGKKFVKLPYTVKGSDLAFSGLFTAAVKSLRENNLEDVCFSLQEVAFSMVAEVTERAVAHTKKREILLVGGVAANRRLQEMIEAVGEEQSASVHVVPPKYAADNGVMIAWTGLLMYKSGVKTPYDVQVNQKYRTDQVDVTWV